MRNDASLQKIQEFLEQVGRKARGPGRIYLVGGSSAVLEGWRPSTIDIDLKLDPEPPGIFEAIRDLKEELELNIELASPDHFLPPLPGWKDRSVFIGKFGAVEAFHYDFYSQALAKIERGHAQDVSDVQEILARGLADPAKLRELALQIEPELIRYPAIDPDRFRKSVEEALGDKR